MGHAKNDHEALVGIDADDHTVISSAGRSVSGKITRQWFGHALRILRQHSCDELHDGNGDSRWQAPKIALDRSGDLHLPQCIIAHRGGNP